ncbi:glycoside hydrolase family 3 C-terminal domain-containing protein [Luteibacter rhizovicinus]|uniref:glycoside hydrolase family 3 C-terminal domain-containing protein n=1 Tax=Luteibacter rhizovicinus TaxID=242606 RepID=UPI003D18CD27
MAISIASLLLPVLASAATPSRPWMNTSLTPDQRADLVLGQMTQEEKFRIIRADFGQEHDGIAAPVGALGSAGYTPGIERLGIPAIQETDAGLGVTRPGADKTGAIGLPAGTATAASFDTAIAYAGGAMIGGEARSKGFNVLLAGGVNLVRDPRNGRNFEYAGEDPLLAGTMAGYTVRGVQDQKVVSTVKHYVLNDLESGRNTLSADIDPVALRESDLLAFQIAVHTGDPGSVMCSYNRVNGKYTCEDEWLLNGVLKGEWGFKGYVMSDWGSVHSAAPSALAGLDQESAGEVFDKQVFFDAPLREAVKKGEVPQSRLDNMAHRILRTMFAKGVIDDPVVPRKARYAEDRLVAQKAAEAGAVLLKNEKALLPIARSVRSVAVIGGHADKGVLSGGGSSAVLDVEGSPVEGLMPQGWPGPMRFHPSAPLTTIKALAKGKVSYDSGTDIAAAAKAAAGADVAVVFVTQWAAESFDHADMALDGNQDALIAAVAKANPRTVVVLETNGAVRMPWLNDVGAVMEAWYPGSGGGAAIGRLLFGEVTPSGHLPMSWPKDESQLPRAKVQGAGLGSKAAPADRVDYTIEGADVGYRWFEKTKREPLFPFGFGLSYTTFAYSDFETSVDASGKPVARFTLRNTGKTTGADVPQLYVTAPGATARLAGWRKVWLKPGESQRVEIAADPLALARFDTKGNRWRVAAGAYSVRVGSSATKSEGQATVTIPESVLP